MKIRSVRDLESQPFDTAADLMQGTGRFNLAQGMAALCTGIGAALSNAVSGYVVQWFGYPTGFLFLAGAATCALIFFALLMPETRGWIGTTQPVAALTRTG